jgi:hypothetical protein
MDPSVLESCKVCLTWHTVTVGIRPGGSLDPHATVARQTLAVRTNALRARAGAHWPPLQHLSQSTSPNTSRSTSPNNSRQASRQLQYFSIDFSKYFSPSVTPLARLMPSGRKWRQPYGWHPLITYGPILGPQWRQCMPDAIWKRVAAATLLASSAQ